MNARMCEQTFGRTNMHADRQTDGRTDSNICPHACVHGNTRTHALMNARMYDQTFRRTNMHKDRQTVKLTDRRTDSHIRPHARAHAHKRMLACLHAHTMHSGTYDGRIDIRTYVRAGGKHPSTNVELEVRNKKLEVRS